MQQMSKIDTQGMSAPADPNYKPTGKPQEHKPILVQTKLDNIKSTEGWKNYMKCHTWVKYTKSTSFSPVIVID